MKRWIFPLCLVAAAAALSVPAADVYYKSSWGAGCARCHEIAFNYDEWRHSSHHGINCVDCHDSTTQTNLRRVAAHVKGEVPTQVHLKTDDVLAMLPKCQRCHRQEFAQWSSGAHSTTYARIFADRVYNSKHALADDCLRCHGMHYEGSIGALVKDASIAKQPAIPCLACHSIHREGATMTKPSRPEILRPSVGLYDRRTRTNIAAIHLPLPAILDHDRPVKVSPDPRQALCYQCHAPLSTMEAKSGDDRTPLGVHEGLSCFACHQKHGQQARQSCADCHPRLSNCGRDVATMDTTSRDPKSPHNVHTVKCADCHPNGIPKNKFSHR